MSTEFFNLNLQKAKNIYEVKKDKTSLDKFIIKLKKEFGDTFHGISVRGLSAGINNFNFKQLPYGFEQRSLYWEAKKIDNTCVREYYLKLYVNFDKFPFYVCNMDWVHSVDSRFKKSIETEFYSNRDIAFKLIEDIFKKNTSFFMVSVFCGILPQSTWQTRCYIKVIIKLPVTGIDVFVHSGINNLTDFGRNYTKDIKLEFIKIVDTENHDVSKLFVFKKERESITRRSENIVRKKMGLKNVGEALVNETLLANITKKMFPDAIRQYRPKWLGRFIIDIYLPSLNVAIEYNGEQHYNPIKRFGGEDKLIQQKARDEFVRVKCKEYNVILIEWPYTSKVTEKNVYEIYSKYIDIKNYDKPLTLFDY